MTADTGGGPEGEPAAREDLAYPGEAEIRAMIDRYAGELKAAGAISSVAVERAFRAVERHRLVETFYQRGTGNWVTFRHDPGRPRRDHLEVIYADTALVTRQHGGLPASSTSQASLVAAMLELLDLREGMKVLEVGAGTGYNAALLAEIVGDQRLVVTVDVLEDVVDQTRRLLADAGYPRIQVLLRDGFEGVPEQAPFDRIVATVGCSDLSPRWAEQLADDGAMLVPLQHASSHPLVAIRKHDGGLRGRFVCWTGFMPVRGPLHIDDLWTHGVVTPETAEVVHEPGPRFARRRPDDSPGPADEETSFLLFAAINDRRASWTPNGVGPGNGRASWTPDGVGLSAGPDGWAGIGPDGLWWWKDESLAREVDRLYRDWDARGRPALEDYQVSFVPIGRQGGPPPGGWQVERRFYRELLTLGSA